MLEYRVYAVDSDGHITGFEPLVCASDGEAIERAEQLFSGKNLEIWSGPSFVTGIERIGRDQNSD